MKNDMCLSTEDLLAIKEMVVEANAAIITRLAEHDLTLYGPARLNGLRGSMKDIEERQNKQDRRWYKLIGIAAGIQVAVTIISAKIAGFIK